MGGQGSGGSGKKVPFVPDPSRKPYERQPKETDPAWKAFVGYRDMAARSTAKLQSVVGKSKRQLDGWSSKWGWRVRVEAWDMEADDRRRSATLKEIDKMQRRHLRLSKRMQDLGRMELDRKLKAAREKQGAGAELSAKDIRELIEAGAKLERLSRGEPESIGQMEHTGKGEGPIDMRTEIILVRPDQDQG